MISLKKLFASPDLTALTFRELVQISNKKASNPKGKLAKAKCRKLLEKNHPHSIKEKQIKIISIIFHLSVWQRLKNVTKVLAKYAEIHIIYLLLEYKLIKSFLDSDLVISKIQLPLIQQILPKYFIL